eukprot:UN22207
MFKDTTLWELNRDVRQAFAESNSAYWNSGLNMELRIHSTIDEYEYENYCDADCLRDGFAQTDKQGADIGMLLVTDSEAHHEYCGIAYSIPWDTT